MNIEKWSEIYTIAGCEDGKGELFQGMWTFTRTWKKQGKESPLGFPENNADLPTPLF